MLPQSTKINHKIPSQASHKQQYIKTTPWNIILIHQRSFLPLPSFQVRFLPSSCKFLRLIFQNSSSKLFLQDPNSRWIAKKMMNLEEFSSPSLALGSANSLSLSLWFCFVYFLALSHKSYNISLVKALGDIFQHPQSHKSSQFAP